MKQRSSFINKPQAERLEPVHGQRPPPQRKRHLLTALLIVQISLLLLIFPWLFVYFENDQIQIELEQADDVEALLSEPRPSPSYLDGLLWSLYTPITIGPAEVWPQTPPGRLLIRISDLTKLLTVGTAAALFHDTLTARKPQKGRIIWYVRRSRRTGDEQINEPEEQQDWVLLVNKQRLVFQNKSTREIAKRLVDLLLKLDRDPPNSKGDHDPYS